MNIEPLAVPTSEEAASGKVGHIDAVVLLTDRVQGHDPRFRVDADNAEAVSRLCRRLDGIPWRSSSPRRGSGCSPWDRSSTASMIASTC